MHKYIHNVTKVRCALYVRCALSVLQKECRKKFWSARYTLGARYRSENTVISFAQRETTLAQNCDSRYESPDFAPSFRCIGMKLLSAYFVNQNSTCMHLKIYIALK